MSEAAPRTYPEPLDVGVDGHWWDLSPLRLDRSVPLQSARPGRITALYALHAADQFVYVGHTTNLAARLTAHRRHAGPWLHRIRVAWLLFENVEDARRVERMVAGTRYWHRPDWNRTGYGSGRLSASLVDTWFRTHDAPPPGPSLSPAAGASHRWYNPY